MKRLGEVLLLEEHQAQEGMSEGDCRVKIRMEGVSAKWGFKQGEDAVA